MKPVIMCSVLVFTVITFNAFGDTLTQWNFNSNPPDPTNNFPTGTLEPSVGAGAASLVGGATSTFASGSTVDPAAVDDSAWNTAGYPGQGTGNKTRGVQFRVSTLGFESIMVTWEQRNSATSSRYWRFQYSSDGVNFVDGAVITAGTVDTFGSQSVNLNSIVVANDNPNFAFRLVSEFANTATGSGGAEYAATGTGAYATSGTLRLDYVTVSGVPATGNNFPTISPITNQTIREGELLVDVPFVVGDVETPADELILNGLSSNPSLVADTSVVFNGSGPNRTVTVIPNANQSGTTTITVIVTDGGDKTAATSFVLTVLPLNTPPTLSSSFTNVHTLMNVALPSIPFTVGDLESPPEELDVTVSSSNPTVVPESGLALDGSGAAHTLTITPAPNQIGSSVITVTVGDLQFNTSRSFNVMVVPSANVVLCEPFDYPDGPVTTNSAGLWNNHSGIFGQANVAGGALQLTGSETEDVNARLIGSPYATNSGAVLYASMKVTFTALPGAEYFAHYREPGGTFRARIFGTVSNVTLGSFRLGIANTLPATGGTVVERDLSLNTTYLVVSRYDVRSGVSALWLDPSSESDAHVTATDPVEPDPIVSFAFRQSNATGGIGDLTVNDLKIGLSFSDVVSGAFDARLTITRAGAGVEVSWPAAATDNGYAIQTSATLGPSANWQTPGGSPVRNGNRDVLSIGASAANGFFRLRK